MKNKPMILAAFAIAILASGCRQPNSTSEISGATNSTSTTQIQNVATNVWQKTKNAATNAWSSVKIGATNTWADIKSSRQTNKDYPYDKKDAFVTAASADLDALDQKIKELADKTAAAGDSVKNEAQLKLQDLRDRRAGLDEKLTSLKNATKVDWDEVKMGFQTSYDDTKASLKQAWQWLTGKLNS